MSCVPLVVTHQRVAAIGGHPEVAERPMSVRAGTRSASSSFPALHASARVSRSRAVRPPAACSFHSSQQTSQTATLAARSTIVAFVRSRRSRPHLSQQCRLREVTITKYDSRALGASEPPWRRDRERAVTPIVARDSEQHSDISRTAVAIAGTRKSVCRRASQIELIQTRSVVDGDWSRT